MHLQHKNLVRGTSLWQNKEKCRDFDTIEEMNEAVISSINNTVPKEGILFHCGDILFGDKTKLPYWISKINCSTIYNLYGNHCVWLRKNEEYQKLFSWCGDYLEIFVGNRLVCLFHYPLKSWNERQKKSIAITGHEHGDLPYQENEYGIDVGWDVWKRPLSWKDIEYIISKKVFGTCGHHQEENQ